MTSLWCLLLYSDGLAYAGGTFLTWAYESEPSKSNPSLSSSASLGTDLKETRLFHQQIVTLDLQWCLKLFTWYFNTVHIYFFNRIQHDQNIRNVHHWQMFSFPPNSSESLIPFESTNTRHILISLKCVSDTILKVQESFIVGWNEISRVNKKDKSPFWKTSLSWFLSLCLLSFSVADRRSWSLPLAGLFHLYTVHTGLFLFLSHRLSLFK